MATRSVRPDLNAFLDAYGVLGVEYGASSLEIAKAFKRQARAHHPDRYPAGSPEQRQATERMTALNAAYQLVRDAPLRHHRISTGARANDPWTDEELDAAVRRAQSDVVVSRGIRLTLSALGVGLCLFALPMSLLSGPPLAVTLVGGVVGWVVCWMAVQTRAGLYAYRIISNFGSLARILARVLQGSP